MSEELESNAMERHESEADASYGMEPAHAAEDEGFEEDETLSEEMGELVEYDSANDECVDESGNAPFDAHFTNEALAGLSHPAQEIGSTPACGALRNAVVDALAASRFSEFVGRLAAAIGQHSERLDNDVPQMGKAGERNGCDSARAAARLKQMQMLLQMHEHHSSHHELFTALTGWFVSANADEAVPVLAGIVAWTLARASGQSATWPLSIAVRRRIAGAASDAAWALIRQGGPEDIRVLARIARSVSRVARRRNAPPEQLPAVLLGTVGRVAAQPRLMRLLAVQDDDRTPHAGGVARRAGARIDTG
jgi:hypothetical protein